MTCRPMRSPALIGRLVAIGALAEPPVAPAGTVAVALVPAPVYWEPAGWSTRNAYTKPVSPDRYRHDVMTPSMGDASVAPGCVD